MLPITKTNKNINMKRKSIAFLTTLAVVASGTSIVMYPKSTSANTTPTTLTPGAPTRKSAKNGHQKSHKKIPAVWGTVSAIDGTTFTLIGGATSTPIYTVDAGNAKILALIPTSATTTRGRPTQIIQASHIKIGDTVMVQGTINGTSVTAKTVIDGKLTPGSRKSRYQSKHRKIAAITATTSPAN